MWLAERFSITAKYPRNTSPYYFSMSRTLTSLVVVAIQIQGDYIHEWRNARLLLRLRVAVADRVAQ